MAEDKMLTQPSALYSGNGGVSNLGNYGNTSNSKNSNQSKNREVLLNSLVNGSPVPNNVKKCSELLSTDKKKGMKLKSEE